MNNIETLCTTDLEHYKGNEVDIVWISGPIYQAKETHIFVIFLCHETKQFCDVPSHKILPSIKYDRKHIDSFKNLFC